MNTYIDAEYEQIRQIMDSRNMGRGQLPSAVVTVIPAGRADRVMALDERLQKLQKIAPAVILAASAAISFLAGLSL